MGCWAEAAVVKIFAGIISVAGLVVPQGGVGLLPKEFQGLPIPTVSATAVADLHWQMYTKRDRRE
jgi:hypothetical protein